MKIFFGLHGEQFVLLLLALATLFNGIIFLFFWGAGEIERHYEEQEDE